MGDEAAPLADTERMTEDAPIARPMTGIEHDDGSQD